jgi:hypothetical protein
MKAKIINGLLILTSLIGYLEWGTTNHLFLFEAEGEIIKKLMTDPMSVLHPFILMPLAGQLLLCYTLFQQKPSKIITYIAIGFIGLLLAFMFVIGIMSQNLKVFASTLPFLITAFIAIRNFRQTT